MTTSIADTSFIVSLVNPRDPDHALVARTARTLRTMPWLPSSALAEICFVLSGRIGRDAATAFVDHAGQGSTSFALLEPNLADYRRTAEIMAKYGDSGLDFVDAVIVAVAERLNIGTILTLDHRHFGVVRPRHRAGFELLPAPG